FAPPAPVGGAAAPPPVPFADPAPPFAIRESAFAPRVPCGDAAVPFALALGPLAFAPRDGLLAPLPSAARGLAPGAPPAAGVELGTGRVIVSGAHAAQSVGSAGIASIAA